MPNRREFLSTGVRAGVVAAALGRPSLLSGREPLPAPAHRAPRHPLRILILGGTSFLGPHQIAYAMARGHTITTFTRGRTEPTVHTELFDHVESLVGDRAGDLEALKGRTWDAVIDNSGSNVEWTRASADLLKDHVDLYLYTSSTGVYYPYLGSNIGEDTAPLLAPPPGTPDDRMGDYAFGVMKANSELEARRAFGDDRTIAVRPTYIVGPADRTERFSYWVEKLGRGGRVLVPGRKQDPVQYIDVRDVAGFMIRLIENRTAGTFNAVGPSSATTMDQFVYGAHAAFDTPADFVWIDDYDFLREHRLGFAIPWIMPVDDYAGTALVDNRKGIAHGLTFTAFAQSMMDVAAWWRSDAVTEERREALRTGERSLLAREPAILAAWDARG